MPDISYDPSLIIHFELWSKVLARQLFNIPSEVKKNKKSLYGPILVLEVL